MANIIDWLKKKNNIIIPKTLTRAVQDDNGNALDVTLNDINNDINTLNSNLDTKISGINNGYYTRLTYIQNVDTSFVAPKNGVLRVIARAEIDGAWIQVKSVGSFSGHAIYLKYLNALDYDCGEVILFEGQEILISSSNMRSVTVSFIDFV